MIFSNSLLTAASRLPMRNWNSEKCMLLSMKTPLPDYLWGIETRVQEQRRFLPKWLPDYLWGIETEFVRVLPESVLGFQTTYEELKHGDRFWVLAVYSFRFQTTYEELKPFSSILLMSSVTASRLPMRNWNTTIGGLLWGTAALPDYLWGIETSPRRDSSFSVWSFQTTYEELKLSHPPPPSSWFRASRLPMRNWNIVRGKWVKKRFQASRLPMRNWN